MFYLSFHSAFCLFLVITHLFSLSLFFVNSLNCIFLKCLEFFDIRDYSFKLCVLGILFGEHFYRNGGFFFGGDTILIFHIVCAFAMRPGCVNFFC